MTGKEIALWVGIAVSVITGVGGGVTIYYQVHGELKQHEQDEVQSARKQQHDADSLNNRMTSDEQFLAIIALEMPKDKQEILNKMRQIQQQGQIAQQVTMYQKSLTMQSDVSADQPADPAPDLPPPNPQQ